MAKNTDKTPVATPADIPRVSYVTIEGVTTVINPQPEKTPAETEESAE